MQRKPKKKPAAEKRKLVSAIEYAGSEPSYLGDCAANRQRVEPGDWIVIEADGTERVVSRIEFAKHFRTD